MKAGWAPPAGRSTTRHSPTCAHPIGTLKISVDADVGAVCHVIIHVTHPSTSSAMLAVAPSCCPGAPIKKRVRFSSEPDEAVPAGPVIKTATNMGIIDNIKDLFDAVANRTPTHADWEEIIALINTEMKNMAQPSTPRDKMKATSTSQLEGAADDDDEVSMEAEPEPEPELAPEPAPAAAFDPASDIMPNNDTIYPLESQMNSRLF